MVVDAAVVGGAEVEGPAAPVVFAVSSPLRTSAVATPPASSSTTTTISAFRTTRDSAATPLPVLREGRGGARRWEWRPAAAELSGRRILSRDRAFATAPSLRGITIDRAAPSSHDHRYLPALDGLRALAVAAVVAYHLGLRQAPGGFLGVDLFFVLSGFLITGLLYGEWTRRGGLDFRRFYSRRARRLLPALAVVLVGVTACAIAGVAAIDRLQVRNDVTAAVGYVANWRFVASGQSYFDQFRVPSPLRHTWSLAIEEQYYLLWPLAVFAVLRLTRGSRRAALAMALGVGAVSATAMALLYHPGGDPSRVYYGTDTRAFELLAGSALALVLAGRAERRARARGDVLGALALAGLVAMWVRVADSDAWMYRGGFLLATLLGVVVVAAVAHPDPGPFGRALSVRPLRWVGKISYGIYLWHWPVIVFLTPGNTGLSGNALRALQVAVSVGGAALSYRLVEQPIRVGSAPSWSIRVATPAVAVALVAALLAIGPVARHGEPFTSVAAAATGSAPVTAPLDLHGVRVATRADPLRVLVVGDSVMWDATPGIEGALEATRAVEVDGQAVLGFRLAKWSAYDWRVEWPKLLARARPDVVVGMLGGWDEHDVVTHGAAWYTALVERATATLARGGARVVWLGYPRTHPPAVPGQPEPDYKTIDRGRAIVNRVFASVARRHAGDVAYLSTDVVLDRDGRYSAFLPDARGTLVRARKHDDTHFCPPGAERMGRLVADALLPAVSLSAPPPSWVSGAWRTDARFDNPHGTCTD